MKGLEEKKQDVKQDKVIERMYVYARVKLVSPLIIGSGNDEITDIDVIKDHKGNPFIPGTSIAGALRNYANSCERYIAEDEEVAYLFGDSINESNDTRMSSLFIYDGIFAEKCKIATRNGVELTINKVAKDQSLYNYQVMEPDSTFILKLEVIIRKKNKEKASSMKNLLYKLIDGLIKEEISLGAKSKRGYGKVKLIQNGFKILILNSEDQTKRKNILKSWLDFDWESFEGNTDYTQLKSTKYADTKRFLDIEADFNIVGSINIRNYAASKDEVDFEHIKSNGEAVIPGTSWGGIIRSHMTQLVKELGIDNNGNQFINDVFGVVDKVSKVAWSSIVSIDESIINDSIPLKQSRVKIDRFTGGAVHSALYTERPAYKGDVTLKIRVLKIENYKNYIDYQKIVGLILLTIKDLGNGILPIGGETAIGRGVLEGVGNPFIKIDGKPCTNDMEKEYLKEVLKLVNTERGYIS